MGSCVSLNKDSESATKLRLWSKNEKLVIPSPVKETVNSGDRTASDTASKPQMSSARFAAFTGSRDEAFFDSQPWLESDCEDDFYSVNGDFTPSRGSTPLHHSFAAARANITAVAEEKIESPTDDSSSPTDKRRRLSELFNDSLRAPADQQAVEDKSIAKTESGNNTSPTKSEDKPSNLAQSTNGTRTNSALSCERTDRNGVIGLGDEDYKNKSVQCCIPSLIRNRTLSGRKKRVMMSPVDHRVG